MVSESCSNQDQSGKFISLEIVNSKWKMGSRNISESDVSTDNSHNY